MTVHSQDIAARTAEGPMQVVTSAPSSEDSPTVLMYMDAPGIRTATRVFAEKLATEGYQVVVPDLYHREGELLHLEPADAKADPTRRQEISRLMGTLTDDGIQADGAAALEACGVSNDEPIAVIGFCLGARAVHRTMQRQHDRVVAGAMWHPSFLADEGEDSPHLSASQIGSLFIGIGEQDTVQSIEMHQPYFDVIRSMEHVTLEQYPSAGHGYTWPDHPSYDEEAANASFDRTLALFALAFAG